MAIMEKTTPQTTHPIIENILITFFSIFVLVGGILCITRGLYVEALFEVGDQGAAQMAEEASRWYGLGFLGYSGLYAYESVLWRKDKQNFLFSLLCCVVFLISGILSMVLPGNGVLCVVLAAIFFGMLALRRLVVAFATKTRQSIILNALMIVFLVLCLLFSLICLLTPFVAVMIVGIFWLLLSLWFICSSAFKRMRLKVLAQIIRKTYAAEIFIGLLSMVVAFSIAFFNMEDGFTTIGDALWYSFAIVTTIGFGDYTVHTVISRVLSVILGLYSLVVVAVLTSIIVNFYSETKGLTSEGHKEITPEKPEEKEAPKEDPPQVEEKKDEQN